MAVNGITTIIALAKLFRQKKRWHHLLLALVGSISYTKDSGVAVDILLAMMHKAQETALKPKLCAQFQIPF